MNSKILLWLAGELGFSVHQDKWSVYFNDSHLGFDLEADTPEGAWLREKVVEWLADEHKTNVVKLCRPILWSFETAGEFEACIARSTRTQAIIAAVEWLYIKEHDND